jgi:hypothetical protein
LSLEEASVATSYTVLVVEQTDVVRRITRRELAEGGCRVLEAANADEALAYLRRPDTHIDLVLIGAIGSVEREQLGWEWPEFPQVGSPYATSVEAVPQKARRK